jgi:hypothetical protein
VIDFGKVCLFIENGRNRNKNGILGVKRDTLMSLVDLMIFRENSLIRNVYFIFF